MHRCITVAKPNVDGLPKHHQVENVKGSMDSTVKSEQEVLSGQKSVLCLRIVKDLTLYINHVHVYTPCTYNNYPVPQITYRSYP